MFPVSVAGGIMHLDGRRLLISVLGTAFALCFTPAAAFAQTKLGLVTSRPCPYSCETRGLPKNLCRDWKEGETCYVEDLSKPSEDGASAMDSDLGLDLPVRKPGGGGLGGIVPPGNLSGSEECRTLSRSELAPPRVNLEQTGSSGRMFERSTIRGSVEGVCIQEAGYFENGRKVEEIPVQTRRQFGRFNFELRARRDRNPEVRVYNTAGESDVIPLR